MKKNYNKCTDEINEYFKQKYLSLTINDIAIYDSTYNYILIKFINFDGYWNEDKIKKESIISIVEYFLEHTKHIFKKYDIPTERIIYRTGWIYQIKNAKTKIEYVVITNNDTLMMNKTDATTYIFNLPLLK